MEFDKGFLIYTEKKDLTEYHYIEEGNNIEVDSIGSLFIFDAHRYIIEVFAPGKWFKAKRASTNLLKCLDIL